MNVSTITMPKEEARNRLRAYRKSLHRRADAEYQAAADGYAALAEGKTLIHLDQAIREGGYFEDMRPRLAIARADRQAVYFEWLQRSESASFASGSNESGWRWRRSSWRSEWRHPQMVVSVDLKQRATKDITGFAMVPMVPPDVREKAIGGLKHYWTLWEVEKWHDRHPTEPPVDPLLLKHVGGSLYAVIAEWDLTELEQAVMRQRVQ